MSSIAIVIFAMQKLGFYLPEIINNYLNDLLCLPLVLGAIIYLIRKLKKDKSFQFPFLFIVLMAAYYSAYFEYYLPKSTTRYTSDLVDVVLYFAGAFLFYGYQKLEIFKIKSVLSKKEKLYRQA